jgi:hypothetical protein
MTNHEREVNEAVAAQSLQSLLTFVTSLAISGMFLTVIAMNAPRLVFALTILLRGLR